MLEVGTIQGEHDPTPLFCRSLVNHESLLMPCPFMGKVSKGDNFLGNGVYYEKINS
jgi:hypothetical protein